MAEIMLARQDRADITEADRQTVRRVLFAIVDGLGTRDRRAWRHWWTWVISMEPGEMARIVLQTDRSSPYHRRHFAMEQALFGSQEVWTSFAMFRDWLKIGAAWVIWAPGAEGELVPVPRSVSYKEADQHEFEEFHSLVLDFLHGDHAAPFLWPHMNDLAAHKMMQAVIGEFDH